jgi:putative FmdB family regulatory protein
MPIYDFECLHCQKEFEVIRKMDERDGLVCPHCGARELKQKVTRFNSNGWAMFLDKMEQKVKSPF